MSKIYLILGNIGVGKTTFIYNLMKLERFRNIEILGADLYKYHYFNEAISLKENYKKAKVFLNYKIKKKILSKEDFILEFVPSYKYKFNFIDYAIKLGYEIITYYIGMENISENVHRVMEREKSGADPVASKKIKSREQLCLNKIPLIKKFSSFLFFIDSSERSFKLLGYYNFNEFTIYENKKWLNKILNKIGEYNES